MGTLAPKNVGWAIYVDQILVPEIKKASEGEVILKTYWGGIMGDDIHVLEKVEQGVLQGAGLSGGGTFLACEELSVLSLPFLFQSYEEVDYIRDKMIDTFDVYMGKNNFALIAWIDQDFDQVYSITQAFGQGGGFSGHPLHQLGGPSGRTDSSGAFGDPRAHQCAGRCHGS